MAARLTLKGIQSVADARKAVEYGVDGIIVSNHAGRQVNGAIASLDALENIVNVVRDKTYIMFDSEIRGASDVVKALALGAKLVFVGRLWVWGLSLMGEEGVRQVMKSLLEEFDILMLVAGFTSVDEFGRSILGLSNSICLNLPVFCHFRANTLSQNLIQKSTIFPIKCIATKLLIYFASGAVILAHPQEKIGALGSVTGLSTIRA